MNTKLIIVDGQSSVGKSSISKSVYQQIDLHHKSYWLHEECENHPIRQSEFSFGALNIAEGMELNRAGMLKKWMGFRDSIQLSGQVCVTEGCFLHAYDRYFVHSIWNESEITAYYSQVLDVLHELNPTLVFLHRPNLRKSLEKAFVARGSWWRDLVLKRDDQHVYFQDHSYINEDSMFAAIEYEQMKMMDIFETMQCSKIKIDTSEEQWHSYVQKTTAFLGLVHEAINPHPFEAQQYIGTYRCQNNREKKDWVIKYDEINKCLYTSLFWDYMPMRCMADNVFELVSFPVELHFQKDNDHLQFSVHGNYDWRYNNQVFTQV